MLLLAIRSRIVVAAMKVLGLETLDGNMTTFHFPKDTPKNNLNKQRYIKQIAALIVDEFVIDKETNTSIINYVLDERDKEQLLRNCTTVDGRFCCRHPGCSKTFKYK